MQLARTKPRLSRLTLRLMALMARFAPRQIVKGAMATLPVPDQAMLTRPEFQDRFIAMIREALRAGPRGAQWDTALMVGPWISALTTSVQRSTFGMVKWMRVRRLPWDATWQRLFPIAMPFRTLARAIYR